ncbi:MAG: acetolactate synthase large subunit, partial [Pseudomonadota bacterium]
MNGAVSLVKTLLAGGVDVCFANPGTSEMHFVAALDEHPEMRCILCLFEGGATGAADGYSRMSGDVAATLLHLAPGFANGWANTHNASKAGSGMLNIVGDHADYHQKFDSPLRSDLPAVSRAVSDWSRIALDGEAVATDGAAALRAARSRNGQIATLILPANSAWGDATSPAEIAPPPALHRPTAKAIADAAKALQTQGAVLFVGGAALHGPCARLAGQIATKTGCRLMADFLVSRVERGEGAVAMERLDYSIDANVDFMAEIETMVLCGTGRPVAFFAYPGKPSTPEPPGCQVFELCDAAMDCEWTLRALIEALDAAEAQPALIPLSLPALPTGPLSSEKVGQALAALMPEGTIMVDESITNCGPIIEPTYSARRHDWLHVTGGAIGYSMAASVGAAIACPDRPVIAAIGDGSAMYTLQSLWTMARENLNITVLIFANRGYQILHGELTNLGVAKAGRNAKRMFDVDEPLLNWVSLAKGHGVSATRIRHTDEF